MTHITLHKRSIARIAAVQSLYQMALIQSSDVQTVEDFQKHFEKDLLKEVASKKYDREFFAKLLQGTARSLKDIDPIIEKALPDNWAFKRIDHVILAILRAATFELWQFAETDSPVIINEYVNVTHAFFDDKEPGFVNGILHNIAGHLRG
jgi:N utilization substance protein B